MFELRRRRLGAGGLPLLFLPFLFGTLGCGDPPPQQPSPQARDEPELLPTGAPCTTGFECRGGSCLDGICQRACVRTDQCGGGACDFSGLEREGACRATCVRDADCRPGQACLALLGRATCQDVARRAPIDLTALQTPSDDARCVNASGTLTTDFVLQGGPTALVVFSADGEPVFLEALEGPDGSRADLGSGAAQIGAAVSGFSSTVIISAPSPGRWRLTASTGAQTTCAYSLSTPAAAERRLVVDVYLSDLGISPADAGNDPYIVAMMRRLSEIFAPAFSVELGSVRSAARADLPEPETTGEWLRRSETSDALLRLPIFLLGSLPSDAQPSLGRAGSLPGPPGLLGTAASGVVVDGALLLEGASDDPFVGARLTGGLAAHHIGHFLGLLHTTEGEGETGGACAGARPFPQACPDRTNLMFPVPSLARRTLTPEQIERLQHHPLVR